MASEATVPIAGPAMRAAASIALVLAAIAFLGGQALAEPAPFAAADLAPSLADRQPTRELRGPLTSADIARYRQLFVLLRQGRWADADLLAAELENRVLLGHVLAARYLAKRAPRASFAELSGWLEIYGDLPQAQGIYKLALARKPAGADRPTAPVSLGAADSVARDLWQSGLVAWRVGNLATAGERFTRLARERKLDAAAQSRAAFWAAR